MSREPLAKEALHRACAPEDLRFETTAELPDLDVPLGQERAVAALELATGMRAPGYNVFALGPDGVGKRTLVERIVARHAATQAAASDWCYLNDFANPQRPRALRLPAGRAVPFKRDMERLVEDLRASIPTVFESEDYRTRLHLLEKQLEARREESTRAVQQHAGERHVTLVRTPVGLMVAPVRGGEVIDPEQFRQLPEEERQQLEVNARVTARLDELTQRPRAFAGDQRAAAGSS